MAPRPLDGGTSETRTRYDRIARFYDLMESAVERIWFSIWRARLWSMVKGPEVLEVGVGTGKNIPYYPEGMRVTAVDLSPKMLDRARSRAEHLNVPVDLRVMDVQHLDFPDGRFDTVVATFASCSVPNPVQGLREVGRVAKPGGRILLLERVRPAGLAGRLADILNPLVVRVYGANINRCTVENARRAGLEIERVEALWRDIVKVIIAYPGKVDTPGRPPSE